MQRAIATVLTAFERRDQQASLAATRQLLSVQASDTTPFDKSVDVCAILLQLQTMC
jgi:hypothetical protein